MLIVFIAHFAKSRFVAPFVTVNAGVFAVPAAGT